MSTINHIEFDIFNPEMMDFTPDIFNHSPLCFDDNDVTPTFANSRNRDDEDMRQPSCDYQTIPELIKSLDQDFSNQTMIEPTSGFLKAFSLFCGDGESNDSESSSSRGGDDDDYDEEEDNPMALPLSFTPTPYTVVCGERGEKYVGNRRLQVIASMFVKRYGLATRRKEKSAIVTEIMDMVQEGCPENGKAFVRYSEGRWWKTTNLVARERIGCVLRDCLHQKYKSSTKSKLRIRHQRRTTAKKTKKLQNYEMVRNNPKFQLRLPADTVLS